MKKLDIVYEDKEILVVSKPSGLLTISDGKTNHTLYSMAREYVKKQHKSNKIFIVHRLDKETSGIVLFAKNENIKKELQNAWHKITKRKYIAILEGNLKINEGVIKEYLQETKTHLVYASSKGEYAETNYKVIGRSKKNTLVDIEIKTGKKHQIRVGFSNLGYPIVGDSKYGKKNSNMKRLALHAYELDIIIHGQEKQFKCQIPEKFWQYIKK